MAMCAANLRGIATASITYATGDPNEQAIPVHPLIGVFGDVGAHDWGGKSGIGEPQDPDDPKDTRTIGLHVPLVWSLAEVLIEEEFGVPRWPPPEWCAEWSPLEPENGG